MAEQDVLNALGEVAENLRRMTTGSDKAMNVAYADETALRPLRTILLNIAQNFQGYLAKETVKETKELEKVTAKINEVKTVASTTAKATQKSSDTAQKTLDSLDSEAKKTASNMALMVRIGQTLMGVVTQAAKNVKDNTMRFGRFAEDLTRAGVSIQDGGKGFRESLTDSANKIGVKTDDFVKMVTGNSRALARLSASGVDQMAYMTDAMAQYKGVAGTMQADSAAVWDYMAESIMRFDTDEQIRNRNMSVEANILLRNFKDLSYATGKSVEELVKEQKARRTNYMEEMFRRTRPELFSKYMSMEMPTEMREYAMTGRMTAEIQKMVALNPALGQMMMMFDRMRTDRRYDTMSADEFRLMMNPIIDRVQATTQGFTAIGPYYAAAENETLMRLMQFEKMGVAKPQGSGGEKSEQIGFVETLKKLDVAVNTLSNERVLALSVSLKSMQAAVDKVADSAEFAATALRMVHDKIGDWSALAIGGGEAAANVVGSLAQTTIGSYFGAKLASNTGKITTKVLPKGGAKLASNTGKITTKVLPKGGTKIGGKMLGKVAPWIAVADMVYDAKNAAGDIYKNGFFEMGRFYEEEAMKASVVDNFIGLLNPMKFAYNIDALTKKTLDTITGRENGKGDTGVSTTEQSTDDLSKKTITKYPQDMLEKVSNQLDEILIVLNKGVSQAEAEAFERKANRIQPNNMTI